MKFEKVLEYIYDDEKRDEMVLKLRRAGENSEAAQTLKKIIKQLRLNEMAKYAEDTIAVQQIGEFFTPEDRFVIFRLVSKKWKFAVETCRVSGFPQEELFLFNPHDVHIQTDGYLNFLRKYLRIFRNIKFKLSPNFVSNWNILTPIIYENMQNLSTISLTYPDNFFTPDGHTTFEIDVPYNEFVSEFIQKNHQTITHVETPRFNIYDLSLENLHFMAFTLKRPAIDSFIQNFPVALQNNENLKIIEINLRNDIEIFSRKILSSNIKQHFITGDVGFLGLLPLKIVTGVDVLAQAQNFSDQVLYLDICGIPYEDPFEEGWSDYQSIISSFPNLRGIVLNTHTAEHFINCEMGEYIDMESQYIWRDRVLYITEVLKIEILDRDEVYRNVDLELRLAKEFGCTEDCAIRLY